MRAPVQPIGCPSAIAPPLTFSFSRRNRLVAQHREHLRRERFVQLDEIEILERQTGPREQLAHRRHGADPHDARIDAGRRPSDDRAPAASRRSAEAFAALISTSAAPPSVIPDEVPAVMMPGCPSTSPNTGAQLAQLLDRRVRPRMLVGRRPSIVAPFRIGHGHRRDLRVETSGGDRRAGAPLRLERVGIRSPRA